MALGNLSTHVLREHARFLILGLDKNHLDDTVLHILLHKVSTYINVLCPVAVLSIIAEKNRSHVVTHHCDREIDLFSQEVQ